MADSTKSEFIRAFVAIAIPGVLIAEAQRVQAQLEAQLGRDLVRWTRAEQLHLTLKFFGNIAATEIEELTAALRRAAEGMTVFRLSLEGAGCFPAPRNPNVLWLGIGGDLEAMKKLQQGVERETGRFGSHLDEREFNPHLTLGRVKVRGPQSRRVGEEMQRLHVATLGEWSVTEMEFIQSKLSSQGSSYTRLTTVRLSAD